MHTHPLETAYPVDSNTTQKKCTLTVKLYSTIPKYNTGKLQYEDRNTLLKPIHLLYEVL